MTWRDEPQSYYGPPPGLSTRLFLKLGDARRRSFAVLIYPASAPWHAASSTRCYCTTPPGTRSPRIGCPSHAPARRWFGRHEVFGAAALRQAGADGYVLVRDPTCRLFGYHGLMDDRRRVLAGPHVRILIPAALDAGPCRRGDQFCVVTGADAHRASVSVPCQEGASPSWACRSKPEAGGNGVIARWGGKQPEAKQQSVE